MEPVYHSAHPLFALRSVLLTCIPSTTSNRVSLPRQLIVFPFEASQGQVTPEKHGLALNDENDRHRPPTADAVSLGFRKAGADMQGWKEYVRAEHKVFLPPFLIVALVLDRFCSQPFVFRGEWALCRHACCFLDAGASVLTRWPCGGCLIIGLDRSWIQPWRTSPPKNSFAKRSASGSYGAISDRCRPRGSFPSPVTAVHLDWTLLFRVVAGKESVVLYDLEGLLRTELMPPSRTPCESVSQRTGCF
jgi:hypothetical protein